MRTIPSLCLTALCLLLSLVRGEGATNPGYLSPSALAASADGRQIYVACATANLILVLESSTGNILHRLPVPFPPLGLALAPDGRTLAVTCAAAESLVCLVDTARNQIVAKIPTGHTTMAPVFSPDGKTLFVCNRFNSTVSFLDVPSRQLTQTIRVPREPVAAALTPDGRHLLVANHLHAGRADVDVVASSVSVIDVAGARVLKEIGLPNGSGLLREVKISPDGRHAVVAHQLSRFHLPTTQVERGWINTSAFTIIDVAELRAINTVLLDNIDAGAANPWGVAWSGDGRSVYVTHAGTHEVSLIDLPGVLARLEKLTKPSPEAKPDYTAASRTAAEVPNDLSFLVGHRQRVKLGEAARGPRAVLVSGGRVYVANYFSDTLSVIDPAASNARPVTWSLPTAAVLSVVRRGEIIFNDATLCLQGWQSCASCHSSDARVDGLNWDNLNDGIGNPKNAKSLLQSHQTPPSMWLGIRTNAEASVRAGIRNSLFTVQPEESAVAMDEYLRSLRPMPSPFLVKGRFSAAAERGRKIFNNDAVGCADCHRGKFFTDMKLHQVGTVGKFDKATDRFDTPTLIETWRSGPYLHDGRAATMRDVFTSCNTSDKHGMTSQLSAREIDDLAEVRPLVMTLGRVLANPVVMVETPVGACVSRSFRV